jgi:hypothetical protein
MKKLLIKTFFILSFFVPVNAQEKCDGILAKLKAECNVVGKSMDKMREFSKENKTIGQSLGISSEKKSLKDFSKENKTIDQTFKNIKEKLKKKDGN